MANRIKNKLRKEINNFANKKNKAGELPTLEEIGNEFKISPPLAHYYKNTKHLLKT